MSASRVGYVLLHDPTGSEATRLDGARAALGALGYRTQRSVPGPEIWIAPAERRRAVRVQRQHILFGAWHGSEYALSACIGRARSNLDLARSAVSEGWGAYLLAWIDETGELNLLRDPSGAIDCVWWRCGAAIVAGDHLPQVAALSPPSVAIDWDTLDRLRSAIELLGDRVALEGFKSVLPAVWTRPGRGEASTVWSPAGLCATARWDDRPQALPSLIDRVVDCLAAPHAKLWAEISGGLDSAIVASSLVATGHAGRTLFANYYPEQPEGDERRYARAIAETLGVELNERPKPRTAWTAEDFAALPHGLRPPLHGLDLAYENDVATRLQDLGATGLMTGQGGDAVFFASPDPAVLRDLVRRDGPLALTPGRVAAVSQWTRRSAWHVLRTALWDRPCEPPQARHPWLQEGIDLQPAKRGQLIRFTNAQLFWGACSRSEVAELLHPLMAQPVAEHLLAIPGDRLTECRRDRSLARRAFADRLPAEVVERRAKGDLSRFYALVIRDSRYALRDFLADGRLVAQGLIGRRQVIDGLEPDALVRDPAANRFLIWAVLEAWVDAWTTRIAARRPS